jgi:hypothetical protein
MAVNAASRMSEGIHIKLDMSRACYGSDWKKECALLGDLFIVDSYYCRHPCGTSATLQISPLFRMILRSEFRFGAPSSGNCVIDYSTKVDTAYQHVDTTPAPDIRAERQAFRPHLLVRKYRNVKRLTA